MSNESEFNALMQRGLNRLHHVASSGPDHNEKVFQEWANGRVLLKALETHFAIQLIHSSDPRIMIRRITLELRNLGELRLDPTIGMNRDSNPDLIVRVVLPA